MKTQREIWESIARPVYPSLNEHLMSELKIQAAMDWCIDADTDLARLYDKYVMMKKIMDVSWEDK